MIFSLWPKYLIFVFCLCPSISEESGLTPQHLINTVIEMAWYFNLHDGNRFQFSDKIRFANIQWHFSKKRPMISGEKFETNQLATVWKTTPESNADPLPLKHIQIEKRSIGKINFDRGQFRDLLVSVDEKLDRKNFTDTNFFAEKFASKFTGRFHKTHESLKIQFPKSYSIWKKLKIKISPVGSPKVIMRGWVGYGNFSNFLRTSSSKGLKVSFFRKNHQWMKNHRNGKIESNAHDNTRCWLVNVGFDNLLSHALTIIQIEPKKV